MLQPPILSRLSAPETVVRDPVESIGKPHVEQHHEDVDYSISSVVYPKPVKSNEAQKLASAAKGVTFDSPYGPPAAQKGGPQGSPSVVNQAPSTIQDNEDLEAYLRELPTQLRAILDPDRIPVGCDKMTAEKVKVVFATTIRHFEADIDWAKSCGGNA